MVYEHSNFKELLTVLIGVQSFQEVLRNKKIQVLSDNVMTVAYVNSMGGVNKKFTAVVKSFVCGMSQAGMYNFSKTHSGVEKLPGRRAFTSGVSI